ncbi:MAG: type I methionyl aminopeptidase [Clostridia bacterium]|nr:type I methionyl aminopeptidase [Clostridia bacterium]
MIVIKTERDIELMRISGRITAGAMEAARRACKPGITTAELDKIIHDYILSHGAKPSFLGYAGFPGSACISVNDELIHGIPDGRKIETGDIVTVDVGACYKGMHTDMADTFVTEHSPEIAKKLYEVTKESFYKGLANMKAGNRLGDVSAAIQEHIEKAGFFVVKKYVGHGVGYELHEDPSVPNYGTAGRGVRLQKGMTLAVEPMVNERCEDVKILANGWTVVPALGGYSAHYENTVLITDGEPELLTKL